MRFDFVGLTCSVAANVVLGVAHKAFAESFGPLLRLGYPPYGHPPAPPHHHGLWPGAGPGYGSAGSARSLGSFAETSTTATQNPDGEEDDVYSFFG